MTCTTCTTCIHGALKDATNAKRDESLRRMARVGFVNCTDSPGRADFHSIHHVCERFKAVPQEISQARIKWATTIA